MIGVEARAAVLILYHILYSELRGAHFENARIHLCIHIYVHINPLTQLNKFRYDGGCVSRHL